MEEAFGNILGFFWRINEPYSGTREHRSRLRYFTSLHVVADFVPPGQDAGGTTVLAFLNGRLGVSTKIARKFDVAVANHLACFKWLTQPNVTIWRKLDNTRVYQLGESIL